MSVRRLAPKKQQPASFTFAPETLAWAKAQIAKYPHGREAAAAIAILWRVPEEGGGLVSDAPNRSTFAFRGIACLPPLVDTPGGAGVLVSTVGPDGAILAVGRTTLHL